MSRDFERIESTLALWTLLKDGFSDFMFANGVKLEHWYTPAKAIVEEYTALKAERGHEYANWKLKSKILALREGEIQDFPRTDSLFRAWYLEALEPMLREKLIVALSRNEKPAGELCQAFLESRVVGQGMRPIGEGLAEWKKNYLARRLEGESSVTLPGFEFTSQMIGGFNPGRLTILSADTGFGKTNVGVHLAVAAAKKGLQTAYVNMEMIPDDMHERIFIAANRIRFDELRKMPESAIENLISELKHLPLVVSDGSEMAPHEIESHLRQAKTKTGLSFAVVDYDQKLVLDLRRGIQEWQALQRAMVALESMAKILKIHIVVLAQTSEDGGISGSRRSAFPASAVLRFYEDDDGRVVLEAVKNRFGMRHMGVFCDYDPARAMVRETEISAGSIKKKKQVRKL
jgi:hypothetical protein